MQYFSDMDIPANTKQEPETNEPEIPKPSLIEEFKHAFQDIWAPLANFSKNHLPHSDK